VRKFRGLTEEQRMFMEQAVHRYGAYRVSEDSGIPARTVNRCRRAARVSEKTWSRLSNYCRSISGSGSHAFADRQPELPAGPASKITLQDLLKIEDSAQKKSMLLDLAKRVSIERMDFENAAKFRDMAKACAPVPSVVEPSRVRLKNVAGVWKLDRVCPFQTGEDDRLCGSWCALFKVASSIPGMAVVECGCRGQTWRAEIG